MRGFAVDAIGDRHGLHGAWGRVLGSSCFRARPWKIRTLKMIESPYHL